MGVDIVLSLRLPPLNGTCAFPAPKIQPERGWDLLRRRRRRRRCVMAAEAANSRFSRDSEGNSDWRAHNSLDGHHESYHQNRQQLHRPQYRQLPEHRPFHHYHHPQPHHTQQGSSEVRFGSGISVASERYSGEMENLDRAFCTSSFFHHSKCPPSMKGEHITMDSSHPGGVVVAGGDLPLSLKVLKRKHQDLRKPTVESGLSEVGNSLLNAFSSVVSMMKTLQSHTLRIGRHFFEQEIESLLSQVQRDMHVSFLWLFQQVFSCTPELMVLVMVLLADFTTFSMANNMPTPQISVHAPPISAHSSSVSNLEASDEGLRAKVDVAFKAPPAVLDGADGCYLDGGSVGNGSRRVYCIAGGDGSDRDPYNSKRSNLNKAHYSVDDNRSVDISSNGVLSIGFLPEHATSGPGLRSNDFSPPEDYLTALDFSTMAAAHALEELSASENLSTSEVLLPVGGNDEAEPVQAAGMREAIGTSGYHLLDQETMRSLVAPFSAQLEDDDYPCYDRTDLSYQDAIRSDAMNSMLLTNYAQFLFLVRKDHDRAEKLFQKAVMCDPFDCNAISGFASFLWLARHNLVGAETAYAAAVRAEPTNSFHAANYAHFLWNAGL